jgi:hypothetical protein
MRYFKIKLKALIPCQGELLLEAHDERDARSKAVLARDHRRVTYLPVRVTSSTGQLVTNGGARDIEVVGVTELDIDTATEEALREFLDYREDNKRLEEDDAFWAEHGKQVKR